MKNEDLIIYLKNRRLELGLTLVEVGEKVGVNASTINRWESGDIENMKRDKVQKYADALRIPPAVVMGWDEPPIGITVELSNYEEEILQKFRSLPQSRQHDVERIINMYYEEASS